MGTATSYGGFKHRISDFFFLRSFLVYWREGFLFCYIFLFSAMEIHLLGSVLGQDPPLNREL